MFGATGSGAIRLRSNLPFLTVSRTYTTGDGGSGSHGQLIPGLAETEAIDRGILLHLINDPGAHGFRSNLGFVNPTRQPASVSYRLYDAGSATLLGEDAVVLPPLGQRQVNDLFGTVGAAGVVTRNAAVEFAGDVPVFVYGSVVDNVSGDPVLILPDADRGSAGSGNLPPDGFILQPAGDVSVEAGRSVTFSGSASDPDGDRVTVLWDFGDGETSSELSPGPHTYTDPGVMTVSMTATDDSGLPDPVPPERTVTVIPPGAVTPVDDFFSAVAFTPLSIPAAGVLGNDVGAGGSHAIAALASAPADPNASVVLDPDGSFTYLYASAIDSPVEDAFSYRIGPGGDRIATVAVTVVPVPSLTGLRVSYRLDPWLISGSYGGGIWVSPSAFGPVRQRGDLFVIEVRAEPIGVSGPLIHGPSWVTGDPSVVTVTPSSGWNVTLAVRETGTTSLAVGMDGVSTTLEITSATYQGGSLEVTITQP